MSIMPAVIALLGNNPARAGCRDLQQHTHATEKAQYWRTEFVKCQCRYGMEKEKVTELKQENKRLRAELAALQVLLEGL